LAKGAVEKAAELVEARNPPRCCEFDPRTLQPQLLVDGVTVC